MLKIKWHPSELEWINTYQFVEEVTIFGQKPQKPCYFCGIIVDTWFPEIEQFSCNKCAQVYWKGFCKLVAGDF